MHSTNEVYNKMSLDYLTAFSFVSFEDGAVNGEFNGVTLDLLCFTRCHFVHIICLVNYGVKCRTLSAFLHIFLNSTYKVICVFLVCWWWS